MVEFDLLKKLIVDAEVELVDVEKGNKSAGTRLRKVMQSVRKQAQVVRNKVMELREITPKDDKSKE